MTPPRSVVMHSYLWSTHNSCENAGQPIKVRIHAGIWDRSNKSDPARHNAFAHSLQRYPQSCNWYLFLPYAHGWVRGLTKTFRESIYLGKYQCQPIVRHWRQPAASAPWPLPSVIILQRHGTKQNTQSSDRGALLGCKICIFKPFLLLSVWDRNVNSPSLSIPQPWLL